MGVGKSPISTNRPSATIWEKYLDAYYEKPKSTRTWSGLEVKEVYTPEDLPRENYRTDISDPGDYPFTRGIHRNMFRGRYWTRREVIGMGSPQDTHDRLKLLVDEGGSGLNTIADIPYNRTRTGTNAVTGRDAAVTSWSP